MEESSIHSKDEEMKKIEVSSIHSKESHSIIDLKKPF